MENVNNDRIKPELNFQDEFYCDKNIDRTKFYSQSKN